MFIISFGREVCGLSLYLLSVLYNIPLEYVSLCRICIGEGVALVPSEPAVDAWLGIPEELVGIVKFFHESRRLGLGWMVSCRKK